MRQQLAQSSSIFTASNLSLESGEITGVDYVNLHVRDVTLRSRYPIWRLVLESEESLLHFCIAHVLSNTAAAEWPDQGVPNLFWRHRY